ncbi:MAG: PEP-CTERM sorting domain-containing protein [Planctomycetes bacterium]|nr:PEP-CTERM sorting domain-containing protein [Planctomycetota bacterium]
MKALAVFGMVLAVGATAANAATIYDNRADFEAALLGGFFTDDYNAAGYGVGDIINNPALDIHSNASMSGVVGETDYTSTGFDNWNFILRHSSGDSDYCAGCNGSFLFEFETTSWGDANGVYGAGYDIEAGTDYYAYITYGNGTTENVNLAGRSFFGVTSDLSVKSIHSGLIDGGSTTGGYIELDNLTIGRIPEPAMLSLLALGGLGLLRRRR